MKKRLIKLIYGIGNEGEEFVNLKHNLGKEIIKHYLKNPIILKNAYYEKFDDLILSSNLGYVNQSGKGLKELIEKLKLKPEEILVIHDDADLIFPFFKVSFGSGSAGHKGIESIIKNLKTKNFWRFRIGIQGRKRKKAEEIVLSKWSKKELEKINEIKVKFREILERLKTHLPNELNISKDYFL